MLRILTILILFHSNSILVSLSEEISSSENRPNAFLHETTEKTGLSVNYADLSPLFKNVTSLLEREGFKSAGLLCAKGVFLLYNKELYDSDSDDDVMIFAGKDIESCVQPGSMRSLRLAQNNINILEDALSLFNEERFVAVPFENHVIMDFQYEHHYQRLAKMKQVKSFIMMGKKGWTVTTSLGKYCIKSNSTVQGELPVCPVSNVKTYFGEDINWMSVRRGCTGPQAQQVELKYCFDYGSGELHSINDPNANDDDDNEGKTDVTEVPEPDQENGNSTDLFGGDCDSSIDEFALLMRLRLTHDFGSIYQTQFPLNKAHSWRTEILDNTIEVVLTGLVVEYPSPTLILFIRELYIYFAEKYVWSKGEGWPSKPKQRVLLMAHETQRCLRKMVEKNWEKLTKTIANELLEKIKTPMIPNESIKAELNTSDGLDIVMEFIWLSINFAGAACHAALEFETDFWMDYMNVVYDMYLQPMSKFWGNPKKVLQYYPIVLGGYNIRRHYRVLAAVTSALYAESNLDILPRPTSVEETIETR